MTDKAVGPCFSCKVISVGCLLGIGGYFIYLGKTQPGTAKYVLYTLGSGATALGIGEVFNKSPFRSNENES